MFLLYLSVNAISSTTEVPVFAFQESESERRLQQQFEKHLSHSSQYR